MVRMYKETVSQLLSVLCWIDNHYNSMVLDEVVAEADVTKEGSRSLRDMIAGLQAQLNDEGTDVSLIAGIVRLFQFPFLGNRLSFGTLSKLRRAILLPSELNGLLEDLRKSELTCSNCGGMLYDGQLIVLSSKQGHQLFCVNCMGPTCVTCKHGHKLPVTKPLIEALMKAVEHKDCAPGPEAVREVREEERYWGELLDQPAYPGPPPPNYGPNLQRPAGAGRAGNYAAQYQYVVPANPHVIPGPPNPVRRRAPR